MNSSKCPKCSLVQWADSGTCKRCGSPLYGQVDEAVSSSPATFAPQNYQPNYGSSYAQPELKTGLAIASMVVGIIAFPTTFMLIGFLLAPVAIVLGIVALVRANKKPNVYGGKGFAIAGIAVGSVICVFFAPIVAAIAIPNLLAAKRAANEGSALSTLQTIALAQDKHASTEESGDCGDLMGLALKNLIDARTASGKRSGYRFTAGGNASDTYGCEVRATPESPSEGTRSFYFSSSDGVVRVATNGSPANYTDPPITQSRASR